MKPENTLAISGGDPQGVGPEICALALEAILPAHSDVSWLIAGDEQRIMKHAGTLFRGALDSGRVQIKDCPLGIDPGPAPSREGGDAAMRALQQASQWVEEGRAVGLVTAPLSKGAVSMNHEGFMGHTEYFGDRFRSRPLMMLGDEKLRVFLATTHIPLSEVAEQLTVPLLLETIEIAREGLRVWFGLEEPRLAVLSLNPHCGEGGALGMEEIEIIEPAILAAGGLKGRVSGPFAADGFFGCRSWQDFDGVIAIFHDQGLIPLKTVCGMRGVNVTLGLPFLRTSPDHGTAFGLVGTDNVDFTSMEMALNWCAQGRLGRIM